ncbi:hypothetical protein QBD01_003534 [Ochrobactrum sp. 19YEA23]|uniref:hypothetical protein n=1 Tax=Ochrobactrum sp. 19YEA23 TaxID=3039854 RepID=UPI00247AB426|nr:hypothetical protein [Ochrobactrum sp. 19YEA23]
MAIPSAYPTKEILHVDQTLQTGDFLEAVETISDETVSRIGRCVIRFSFIELNLRRAIEMAHKSGKLPEKIGKHPILKLPIYSLVSTLKSCVDKLGQSESDQEITSKFLDEIEELRAFRNILAHFAPYAVTGHDAIVFLSRSESDAEKVFGAPLNDSGLMYALLPISGLEYLDQRTKWLDKRLAEKIFMWGS